MSSDAELTELALFDLARLVGVESPSGDVAAITRSAQTVAALIGEWLGRPAALVDGPVGPHVHWSGGGTPRVLVLGHHDTVFPIGTLGKPAVHGRRRSRHRPRGVRHEDRHRPSHPRRRLTRRRVGCRVAVLVGRGDRLRHVAGADRGAGTRVRCRARARTVGRRWCAEDRPQGCRHVRGRRARSRRARRTRARKGRQRAHRGLAPGARDRRIRIGRARHDGHADGRVGRNGRERGAGRGPHQSRRARAGTRREGTHRSGDGGAHRRSTRTRRSR